MSGPENREFNWFFILGMVASLLGIFSFVTGKQSLPDAIQTLKDLGSRSSGTRNSPDKNSGNREPSALETSASFSAEAHALNGSGASPPGTLWNTGSMTAEQAPDGWIPQTGMEENEIVRRLGSPIFSRDIGPNRQLEFRTHRILMNGNGRVIMVIKK